VYVDRYGNGKGKAGYVKRERIWKVARPKGTSGKKTKEGHKEAGSGSQEKTDSMEGGDEGHELKELESIETGPQNAGLTAALG